MIIAVTTLSYREKMASPTPEEAMMVRKAHVLIHYAIDLWIGELARQGRAEATRRKYRQILDPFGDTVRHKAPAEVTTDDIREYLDRWADKSASTLALYVTVLRRFFRFLTDEGIVRRDPAERLQRPRRKRAEDVAVVSVSDKDVRRLLEACTDWQETICVHVLVYMGVRRQAAARVRRRDVDLNRGLMSFLEKGGKQITKPIPDALLALLRRADDLGQWPDGDAWLIPNRKPWLVRPGAERGHKVIYETVQRVADRAGVRAHPHALRAAFAVQFDEQHPDKATALKELLGHSRIETTMVYLRRKNKAAAMEAVRNLSFALPAHTVIPPAGFEPALGANALPDSVSAVADEATVADRLLAEARSKAESEKSSGRVDAGRTA